MNLTSEFCSTKTAETQIQISCGPSNDRFSKVYFILSDLRIKKKAKMHTLYLTVKTL